VKKLLLLTLILILLFATGLTAKPRQMVKGIAIGVEGGYWSFAGNNSYFGSGFEGSFRAGYRVQSGDLELALFFDYTYLVPGTAFDQHGTDITAQLLTFGFMPRISFSPDYWMSPYFGAGVGGQMYSTSLDLKQPDANFGYQYNNSNLVAVAEVGVEFPFLPSSIASVGLHYTHAFVEPERHFSGISIRAGYSYFF